GERRAQALWRGRGSRDLVLRPADGAGEHRFPVLTRTLDGASPVPPGADLARSGPALEAMDLARRTGQPAASRTYLLARDRSVPDGQRQLSLVLAPPLSDGRGTRDAGVFRAWRVMGIHGR